jgi:hypothetical protein
MRNMLTSLFLSFAYCSLPDPMRLSLEATSAKWFRGVWICGLIVAAGCVFEIWEVAFSLRNWWRVRHRLEEVKDNPGSWKYPLAALGLFLVVGGIVGETLFEVLDADAESQIRSHESDVVSDAEGRLGPLEKEAGQLNKDAEGERLARVKLEAEISPRRLSADQETAIAKALAGFKGKIVSVATYRNDPEAMILGIQIAEALGKAHITAQNRLGTFDPVGLPMFVNVVVDTNSSDKKLVCALASALKTQGKLMAQDDSFGVGPESTMVVPSNTKHEDAFIFIGPKLATEEMNWASKTPITRSICPAL